MDNYLKSKLELFKKLFPHEEIVTIAHQQGAEHYILDINNTWICKITKNRESTLLHQEASLLHALKNKIKTSIPYIQHYEPECIIIKKFLEPN